MKKEQQQLSLDQINMALNAGDGGMSNSGVSVQVFDIADNFDISKPSISHHLSILHQAELVLRERRGQQIFYSLNTTVFQQVIEWLYNLKGE